ncbi:putative PEP-CTERM system TPR-repeat lipoprotein [compost metagenome]
MKAQEMPGLLAEACVCGSGLGRMSCCGLDLARVEAVPPEHHAEALTALTHAYHAGDRDAAHRLAIAVLEESPGQRDALGALFNILRDAEKWQAAASVVHRMAHIHQNDAVVRSVATTYFLQHGDLAHAQLHGRMLVRLAPEEPVAHALMGRIFLAIDNASAAEYHLRLAVQLSAPEKANAPDLQVAMAQALRDQGKFDEARAIFESLRSRKALTCAMLLEWAGLEERVRDFSTAFALVDEASALEPRNPAVAATRAGLYRRVDQPERALEALASPARTSADESGALLRKGQILDSLGRFDEAFECFSMYKAWLRETSGQSYQRDEASTLVASLRDFFTEGRTRLLPRAAVREDSPQPIFIIGFPRSGTTLVEQTLSSHPNIAAGDELPIINAITARAQMLLGSPAAYPTALSELWLGDRRRHVDTLRDLYLNEAMQFGAIDPKRRWFTDKMPLNETHLGLIHLLFPQSPIIHLVRHPLVVVLSVFSNGLTHGFFCAYALETAAQHYALIADLVAQYRAVMPLRYHAVRYEDLVTGQVQEVRSMLDFIGEPFDAQTLAFHENARHARTASYAQVTEKLYTRSRYRYRNYRKQLEPVVPLLESAIKRLGYLVDS